MYESPIEMIQTHMQNQIDKDVLKILMDYDIKVDKNELIRALQYDRDQYNKGYADAKAELVRCKDCVAYTPYPKPVEDFDGTCSRRECETDEMEFCSYGERKIDSKNRMC